MGKISATMDLCTHTTNKKTGARMLITRYSMWVYLKEFRSKKEARTFAEGLVSGLSFKYANAAVRITYTDGTEESTF